MEESYLDATITKLVEFLDDGDVFILGFDIHVLDVGRGDIEVVFCQEQSVEDYFTVDIGVLEIFDVDFHETDSIRRMIGVRWEKGKMFLRWQKQGGPLVGSLPCLG